MSGDSSHAGFLGAILAEPDDNSHRLVYADWLDDHGDPDRAEFIRIQCELAKYPKQVEWLAQMPVDAWTGSREEGVLLRRLDILQQRQDKLLKKHRVSWTDKLVPGVKVDLWSLNEPTLPSVYSIWAQFRRGFVEVVTLTCGLFTGQLCDECGGYGRVRYTDMDDEEPDDSCPACHGDGTTEGVAGTLFRATPIREVRICDKEPEYYRISNNDYRMLWFREFAVDSGRHYLPRCLYDLLWWQSKPADRSHWSNTISASYRSAEAAKEALGAAALLLGHHRAWCPATEPTVLHAPLLTPGKD